MHFVLLPNKWKIETLRRICLFSFLHLFIPSFNRALRIQYYFITHDMSYHIGYNNEIERNSSLHARELVIYLLFTCSFNQACIKIIMLFHLCLKWEVTRTATTMCKTEAHLICNQFNIASWIKTSTNILSHSGEVGLRY